MAEKKYLDLIGLGQYDAKIKSVISAGDAATLAEAKSFANGLASNYDAAGSAASAEAAANSYTDGKIGEVNGVVAGVKTIAEKGVSDAAAAKSAADAAQGTADSAVAAAGVADGKAVAAQNAVDALAGKVGTVPEGSTVMGIITNIQENAYDDTELRRLIAANGEAIGAEESARAAADAALDGRLVEVEAFFKLAEGEQLDEALDTLKEIQTYLEGEGAVADQMLLDIAANKTAIEKEVTDRGTAISGVETAYKAADQAIDARVVELEKLLGEADGSVKDQIADAVAAEATLREKGDQAAEASAAAALAAAQAADGKAVAAQGEVDALEIVVAGKVAQGDHDALATRVTTAEGKITTLEGASHTHSNKTDLDGITAQLISNWNDAFAKEHEHANKSVLDGITSDMVSSWNSAESNAKAYTDEKIAEFKEITSTEIDNLFKN